MVPAIKKGPKGILESRLSFLLANNGITTKQPSRLAKKTAITASCQSTRIRPRPTPRNCFRPCPANKSRLPAPGWRPSRPLFNPTGACCAAVFCCHRTHRGGCVSHSDRPARIGQHPGLGCHRPGTGRNELAQHWP